MPTYNIFISAFYICLHLCVHMHRYSIHVYVHGIHIYNTVNKEIYLHIYVFLLLKTDIASFWPLKDFVLGENYLVE